MGDFHSTITYDLHYKGTVDLANKSQIKGINNFIFISSQSIYGIAKDNGYLDEYKSRKNPITAYAKSKMMSEIYLNKIKSKDFRVVFLRPSTVFGASPRLRTDIILNNFLMNAFYRNKITIVSMFTLDLYCM